MLVLGPCAMLICKTYILIYNSLAPLLVIPVMVKSISPASFQLETMTMETIATFMDWHIHCHQTFRQMESGIAILVDFLPRLLLIQGDKPLPYERIIRLNLGCKIVDLFSFIILVLLVICKS